MYIPKPYFEDVPQMGDLYLDYIFFENDYPILFTCYNKSEDLFLCLCFDNYKEQSWYITSVTSNDIESLVYGRISFYNIFKQRRLGCSVKWKPGQQKENYKTMDSTSFLDENLPEPDFFFESDLIDDDIKEYIIRIRNKYCMERLYCDCSEFNQEIGISQLLKKSLEIFVEINLRCNLPNILLKSNDLKYEWSKTNVIFAN